MPRNYDAKNTAKTGGKVSSPAPKCATCNGSKTVRVSKPLIPVKDAPARQRYEIVTQRCPDCK